MQKRRGENRNRHLLLLVLPLSYSLLCTSISSIACLHRSVGDPNPRKDFLSLIDSRWRYGRGFCFSVFWAYADTKRPHQTLKKNSLSENHGEEARRCGASETLRKRRTTRKKKKKRSMNRTESVWS